MLFYSKCAGFTVSLTNSDISLSMYTDFTKGCFRNHALVFESHCLVVTQANSNSLKIAQKVYTQVMQFNVYLTLIYIHLFQKSLLGDLVIETQNTM